MSTNDLEDDDYCDDEPEYDFDSLEDDAPAVEVPTRRNLRLSGRCSNAHSHRTLTCPWCLAVIAVVAAIVVDVVAMWRAR